MLVNIHCWKAPSVFEHISECTNWLHSVYYYFFMLVLHLLLSYLATLLMMDKMEENGMPSVIKFQWNVYLFRLRRMGSCIGITRARNASINDTSENSSRTNSGKITIEYLQHKKYIRYQLTLKFTCILFLPLYSWYMLFTQCMYHLSLFNISSLSIVPKFW